MKIATVTWIKHKNYGTFLQAYALQQIIKKLGYENAIIEDSFILEKSIKFQKSKEKAPLKKLPIKLLKHIVRILRGNLIKNRVKKRIKKFDKFIDANLNLEYNHDFEYLNREYNAFVCGSDQIWSPLDKVFNGYFFLEFTAKPKISYAPSIGINYIPDDKKEKIKELLSDFSAISIREEKGKELLSKLTKKDVELVLDPTLLLDSKDWNKIAVLPKINKGYIFCYFLGTEKWYYDYVEKLSNETGKKVIVVNNDFMSLYHKNFKFYNASPEEFVGLIKNADYICTDSFHGTIFSLIYQKNFITFKRFKENDERNQNSRLENLLKIYNLGNRFIDRDCKQLMLNDVEYNYKKAEKLRKSSLDYLEFSLEKINNESK